MHFASFDSPISDIFYVYACYTYIYILLSTLVSAFSHTASNTERNHYVSSIYVSTYNILKPFSCLCFTLLIFWVQEMARWRHNNTYLVSLLKTINTVMPYWLFKCKFELRMGEGGCYLFSYLRGCKLQFCLQCSVRSAVYFGTEIHTLPYRRSGFRRWYWSNYGQFLADVPCIAGEYSNTSRCRKPK